MQKLEPEFATGSSVWHKTYGAGVVVNRWGDWLACRECHCQVRFDEVQSETARAEMATIYARRGIHHFDGVICPHCTAELFLIGISGRSIYTVRFCDGIHYVNVCWLKRPRLKIAA